MSILGWTLHFYIGVLLCYSWTRWWLSFSIQSFIVCWYLLTCFDDDINRSSHLFCNCWTASILIICIINTLLFDIRFLWFSLWKIQRVYPTWSILVRSATTTHIEGANKRLLLQYSSAKLCSPIQFRKSTIQVAIYKFGSIW